MCEFATISSSTIHPVNQPVEPIFIKTSGIDGGDTDVKQEILEEDPLGPHLSDGLQTSNHL